MKINGFKSERGTILVIALVTITIMTLLCATSLYVTSQNTNSTMQTASWQQALTGAESAVDQAINALNLNAQGSGSAWTNWKTQVASLPSTQPPAGSPAPTSTNASGPPSSSSYNYLIPSAITLQGEGNNSVKSWVTIDTAGLPLDKNNQQWYRVRATGVANAPPIARVSNNKLDDNLRNTLGLRFNRKTGAAITGIGTNVSQVTRSIEVILTPVGSSIWTRGITLKNWLSMSGGGVIDSFDSSNPFKSTNGLYDVTKRQSHGDVGLMQSNNTASDLRSTYVYGNIAYSGPAIKNTSHVQGTISTPFNTTIPATSNPTWSSGTYTSYTGGGNPPFATIATGTNQNPALVKINGDFTVPGGQTVTITGPNSGINNNHIIFWVTGKFTTSGSGYITQNPVVNATWYVDNNITTSGNSYNNQSGLAGNVSFIGVGSGYTATVSGSADFIGTIDAPGYNVTVSGTGNYDGALIGNDLTISGGASFHYDEALNKNGGNTSVGNYAYASWFEDNSDPSRGITY